MRDTFLLLRVEGFVGTRPFFWKAVSEVVLVAKEDRSSPEKNDAIR